MNLATIFLLDILFAAIICIGIVMYVQKHLRQLLVEVCGSAERADFWLVFNNIMLVLIPLIFVMGSPPEFGPGKNLAVEMAEQVKWGLLGFVLTLGFFGLILLRYIPKNAPKPVPNAGR